MEAEAQDDSDDVSEMSLGTRLITEAQAET